MLQAKRRKCVVFVFFKLNLGQLFWKMKDRSTQSAVVWKGSQHPQCCTRLRQIIKKPLWTDYADKHRRGAIISEPLTFNLIQHIFPTNSKYANGYFHCMDTTPSERHGIWGTGGNITNEPAVHRIETGYYIEKGTSLLTQGTSKAAGPLMPHKGTIDRARAPGWLTKGWEPVCCEDNAVRLRFRASSDVSSRAPSPASIVCRIILITALLLFWLSRSFANTNGYIRIFFLCVAILLTLAFRPHCSGSQRPRSGNAIPAPEWMNFWQWMFLQIKTC